MNVNTLINDCKQQLEYIRLHYEQQLQKKTIQYVSIELNSKYDFDISAPENIEHIYWSRPEKQNELLALGCLDELSATGVNRFTQIRQYYKNLSARVFSTSEKPPMAFVVFAFDAVSRMQHEWQGFPNMLLSFPRLILKNNVNGQSLICNIDIESDVNEQWLEIESLLSAISVSKHEKTKVHSVDVEGKQDMPDRLSWLDITNNAIDYIKSSQVKKIVTSRKISFENAGNFNKQDLLNRLSQRYSSCTSISFQRANKQFISITPESLLSIDEGEIKADAIGGTLSCEHKNNCLQLLSKKTALASKLLEEHAIIVEDIYTRLDPLCLTLRVPISPSLIKLHNMYHLETSIQGKLRPGNNILSLVELLHPTPAIAGYPRKPSMSWLRDNEAYERGLYTGAVGWMQGDMDGEFSVLLRCALIEKNQIHLYAGAGLVAESKAEQEWQETELKMKTILDMI